MDRFHVRIGEVYGSTEGTSNLGWSDQFGKVQVECFSEHRRQSGRLRVPAHLAHHFPGPPGPTRQGGRRREHFAKTQRVGHCLSARSDPIDSLRIGKFASLGQTGAMVSTIRPNNPLLVFDGYLNQAETSKHLLLSNEEGPGF